MSEYLDDVFDGLGSIGTCSQNLLELSLAFSATGNEVMGRELSESYRVLQAAEIKIRSSVAKDVNRRAGNIAK